jgi:hypothetical protein
MRILPLLIYKAPLLARECLRHQYSTHGWGMQGALLGVFTGYLHEKTSRPALARTFFARKGCTSRCAPVSLQ